MHTNHKCVSVSHTGNGMASIGIECDARQKFSEFKINKTFCYWICLLHSCHCLCYFCFRLFLNCLVHSYFFFLFLSLRCPSWLNGCYAEQMFNVCAVFCFVSCSLYFCLWIYFFVSFIFFRAVILSSSVFLFYHHYYDASSCFFYVSKKKKRKIVRNAFALFASWIYKSIELSWST